MEKSKAAITGSLNCMKHGEVYLKTLPKKGMTESAVLKRIKNGYHAMGRLGGFGSVHVSFFSFFTFWEVSLEVKTQSRLHAH